MLCSPWIRRNFWSNTCLKYFISNHLSLITPIFLGLRTWNGRFLCRVCFIKSNITVLITRNMFFLVISVVFLIRILICLISYILGIAFAKFWQRYKLFFSFESSFLGFGIWLNGSKILTSFGLSLDTFFLLFNSFEERLIIFELLVILHLIVTNIVVNCKRKTENVAYTNFHSVFDCVIFFYNTRWKSILLKMILRYVFFTDICEFVSRGNCSLSICAIFKNIPLFSQFSKILSMFICFGIVKFINIQAWLIQWIELL